MPPRQVIDTPDGPMTRAEAAAFYGIPKPTLIRRIWEGWPCERWFIPPIKPVKKHDDTPKRQGSFFTPYGRVSLKEAAVILGIPYMTLRGRLYARGWSLEHVFNTPRKGRPGIDFILPPTEYFKRRNREILRDHEAKERKELAYRQRKRRKQHHGCRKASRS